jgi:hypothetical protein
MTTLFYPQQPYMTNGIMAALKIDARARINGRVRGVRGPHETVDRRAAVMDAQLAEPSTATPSD